MAALRVCVCVVLSNLHHQIRANCTVTWQNLAWNRRANHGSTPIPLPSNSVGSSLLFWTSCWIWDRVFKKSSLCWCVCSAVDLSVYDRVVMGLRVGHATYLEKDHNGLRGAHSHTKWCSDTKTHTHTHSFISYQNGSWALRSLNTYSDGLSVHAHMHAQDILQAVYSPVHR